MGTQNGLISQEKEMAGRTNMRDDNGSLMDHQDLKFKFLSAFDKAMIDLAKDGYLTSNDSCYGVAINESDQNNVF